MSYVVLDVLGYIMQYVVLDVLAYIMQTTMFDERSEILSPVPKHSWNCTFTSLNNGII